MSDKGDMEKNKAGKTLRRTMIWGVISAGLTDKVANEEKPKGEWSSQKRQQYTQRCSERVSVLGMIEARQGCPCGWSGGSEKEKKMR